MENFRQGILDLLINEAFEINSSGEVTLEKHKLVIRLLKCGSRPKEYEKIDFKVVNIWEDQWMNFPAIIASRVNSLLGKNFKIPARVCQVKRINKAIADDFLKKNHLQQSTSTKLKYGLFLPAKYFRLLPLEFVRPKDDLLLGVMTFSSPKKYYFGNEIVNSYELIRFSTLLKFNVVGGFSKMISHFIKEKNPGNIMTYVDADWSDGSNFVKIGFRQESYLEPIFFKLNTKNIREKVDKNEAFDVFNAGSYKFILDGFAKS